MGAAGWSTKSFSERGSSFGDNDDSVVVFSWSAARISRRSSMEKLVDDGRDGYWIRAFFNVCKFFLIRSGCFENLQQLTLQSARRQLKNTMTELVSVHV